MKTYSRFLSLIALVALLPFSVSLAAADESTSDAPARAARLQYMSGSVSVQPQGTGEWVTGQLNRPLTNADNVWADKNSRAEISVGTGLIRLDSESSLTLTNVSENMVQMQLHQGAMNLHVRRLYDGETYEVDTPNQAFAVSKPGDYRFDVDSDADRTVITVWRGEGESTGNGPSVRLRENQQARFSNGNSMTNDIHEAPSPDAFDEWARSRDEHLDHSASARHVSPDVVGYEDLDEYGTWRESPEYGDVWVPSGVAVGWAPYRYGHWIWVSPWGWTWVEDEPWGYAPFHYGRWVYGGGYWGWAPGPIYVRPYYAPALVAWFGGPGWGVGFGGGFGYGWCPLGWGEPFVPWYGASFGYFRSVNFTNTHITNINITNIYNNSFVNNRPTPGAGVWAANGGQLRYSNLHSPNGFTAVSRNTLVNSLPVSRNNIRMSPTQLSRVSPVRSVSVQPTRTTMLGANTGRTAVAPPPHSFNRPVTSRASIAANGGGFHSGASVASVNRPATAGNAGGMGRSFPRPPSAGGMSADGTRPGMASNSRSSISRPAGPETSRSIGAPMRSQSVPRPPASGMTGGGGRPQMSAPRGPEGGGSHGGSSAPHSSGGHGPRSELSVPRPQNSVQPQGYSSAAQPGGFANANRGSSIPSVNNERSVPRPSTSYQGSNQGFGNGGGGSRPTPAPSYGGGSYNRPAPSNDRGTYGRPAQSYGRSSYGASAPSYGSSSARSIPSYGGGSYGRSMPSYGRSAPSYGGGSYGGGRPSYGGGNYGGSRSSYGGGGNSGGAHSYGVGGGGGHSSSGSGGSASHSGGGHGGHH